MESARAWNGTFALCCLVTFGCAEKTSNVRLKAHLPERIIAGFPIPVRFMVRGETEFYECHILEGTNPVTIKISSADAKYLFPRDTMRIQRPSRESDDPMFDRGTVSVPLPKLKVPKDRTWEFVIDLSIVPRQKELRENDEVHESGTALVPGTYSVEVLADGVTSVEWTKTMKVLPPNSEEKKFLARVRSSYEEEIGNDENHGVLTLWGVFVVNSDSILRGVDLRRFSQTSLSQIGYHLLFAELVQSSVPLGELALSEDRLATLLPAYRNEALVLKYEIQLAGSDPNAERTRRQLVDVGIHKTKHVVALEGGGGHGLIRLLRKVKKTGVRESLKVPIDTRTSWPGMGGSGELGE